VRYYDSAFSIEGISIIINPHFYYQREDGCVYRLHVEVYFAGERIFEDLNMGLISSVRMTEKEEP
jgi:hypothetical protein